MLCRQVIGALALCCFLSPLNLGAQNSWIFDADGFWEDAANWSSGSVPVSSDDVLVSVGGKTLRTITIGGFVGPINSLDCAENLSVVGGDLEINDGGLVDGALMVGLNRRLFLEGGVFSANGPVNLDGGSLHLRNTTGHFPQLTTYDGLNAIGPGLSASEESLLDLSNLEIIRGTGNTPLEISSRSDSIIDLTGLTEINGGFTVLGSRENGLVDVSNMTQFIGEPRVGTDLYSEIWATAGGEVRLNTDPNVDLEMHHVVIFIGDGILDISRVTKFHGGKVTTAHSDYTVNIVEASSASFSSWNVRLDASSITGELQNDTGMGLSAWSPNGYTDMSGLTSLRNNPGATGSLAVGSYEGGHVDLSNVQTIYQQSQEGGLYIQVEHGTIDLTSVTLIENVNFTIFPDIVVDQGELQLGETVLQGVNIINSFGTISGEHITLSSLDSEGRAVDRGLVEAQLRGVGTIDADFSNLSGRIVVPGNFLAMEVTGSFVQNTPSDLILTLSSNTAYGKLDVGNDVMVGGDLTLVVESFFDPVANEFFPIVTVGGKLAGRFNGKPQGHLLFEANGQDVHIDYFGADGNDIVMTTGLVTQTIAANARKLLDGVAVNGTLASTHSPNDDYLQLDPNPTKNPEKQIVDMIVQAQFQGGSPSRFAFNLEAHVTNGFSGDVIQSVELWNHDSSVWEEFDSRSANGTDIPVCVAAEGDFARFVHPQTGEVIAKLKWVSPVFSGTPYHWSVLVDHIGWIID